jgi:DNA-binding MarR family transcriptional regulator
MDPAVAMKQAQTIATLLIELLRQLAAGANEDPAVELPLAQLRVCRVLYQGPRPMSPLSRELGVSLSAMTQLADRLEHAQLVKRVAQGGDRRVRCLRLTERGEKMMRFHEEVRVRHIATALEHLSPDARNGVTTGLQTMIQACIATKGQDSHPKKNHSHPPVSETIL